MNHGTLKFALRVKITHSLHYRTGYGHLLSFSRRYVTEDVEDTLWVATGDSCRVIAFFFRGIYIIIFARVFLFLEKLIKVVMGVFLACDVKVIRSDGHYGGEHIRSFEGWG